jgi:hypothetical protein
VAFEKSEVGQDLKPLVLEIWECIFRLAGIDGGKEWGCFTATTIDCDFPFGVAERTAVIPLEYPEVRIRGGSGLRSTSSRLHSVPLGLLMFYHLTLLFEMC